MMQQCASPDPSFGVAYRVSTYLDCQARALGENGFQALAGGPLGSSLLFGLVTIFIALIGYRLILGHVPDVRDGVGWALRLGFVLALVGSWPAFQTLVYRVAVDAPGEIVAVLLPSAGLQSTGLDARVQQAYDAIRLGNPEVQVVVVPGEGDQPPNPAQAAEDASGALPMTASLLVISTSGLAGALRIATGFLLAVAPLAIMSLLFSGTAGLFNGWLRALAGLTLGSIGVAVVTALDLMMVESELANLRAFGFAAGEAVDPQALTTIVALFALVAVVATLAGVRMGSALALPVARSRMLQMVSYPSTEVHAVAAPAAVSEKSERRPATVAVQGRATSVAGALNSTLRREERWRRSSGTGGDQRSTHSATTQVITSPTESRTAPAAGLTGRRGLGRRTQSAARRDRWREA